MPRISICEICTSPIPFLLTKTPSTVNTKGRGVEKKINFPLKKKGSKFKKKNSWKMYIDSFSLTWIYLNIQYPYMHFLHSIEYGIV